MSHRSVHHQQVKAPKINVTVSYGMGKVLIIGASKGIGLATAKAAIKQGLSVRAFSRSSDKLRFSDLRLETVAGNALETDDVDRALEGVDAVVQAIGIKAGPEMICKPVRLFSTATKVLIPAMENAGIRRLVCVTGFGAGDSRSRMGCLQSIPFRFLLGNAYDDKNEQERMIKASNLDWTIVRPGILTNGSRTGRYCVLTEPSEWRNGLISRSDVADFLVKQVTRKDFVGKSPVLVY